MQESPRTDESTDTGSSEGELFVSRTSEKMFADTTDGLFTQNRLGRVSLQTVWRLSKKKEEAWQLIGRTICLSSSGAAVVVNVFAAEDRTSHL